MLITRLCTSRRVHMVLVASLSLVCAAPAPSPTSVAPVSVSGAPVLESFSVPTPRPLETATSTTTSLPVVLVSAEAPDNAGPSAVLPGGILPNDSTCAANVVRTPEYRAANTTANHTKGAAGPSTYGNWGTNPLAVTYLKRVTGNFSGTTDELIQWAACKWGFDPEAVRAQVMVESSMRQGAQAGFSVDAQSCVDPELRRPVGTTTVPIATSSTTTAPPLASIVDLLGRTVPTSTTTTSTTGVAAPEVPTYECPTAFGLLQLRSDYQPGTYPMSARSTAFNLDYGLAMKRACYEGVSWLGAQTKGNAWGCVGVHYSGQWLDAPAQEYITRVRDAMTQRGWLRFR